MALKSSQILALALGINGIMASPTNLFEPRQAGGICPNGYQCDSGDSYWAQVNFYSDSDCTVMTGNVCYCTYDESYNSGDYVCEPANIPDGTMFAQMSTSDPAPNNTNVQIDFTGDQSCPPSGPGAIEATLVDNDSCVQLSLTSDAVGVSMFPVGGGTTAVQRGPSRTRNSKRASSVTCSGFAATSSTPSESGSQQVSPIVDCTTSADDCPITTSEQNTTTTSSTYSGTIGGSIGEIFGISASATFGTGYSDSESSSIQEGFSVAVGQKGFLSAYCTATLYHGTYSGCSGDSSTIDGEVLALHSNGFTYELVNTGD